jgi:hypothetical protein
MTKSNSGPLSPIPLVPLMITESEEEYHRIRQGFYDEIGPVGIIEQMYVEDLIDIVWEIVRLKRCKVGVTNMAFHDASVSVLQRFLQAGPDLAYEWISDPKVAKVVEDELAKYKLDGVAKKKSRRRFRSDGTIIRLASTAAKTADHVGDDGGGNTANAGAGAGLPPARKGTAA